MILFLVCLASLVSCSVTTLVPEKHEQKMAKSLILQGTIYLRRGNFEKAQAAYHVAYDLGTKAESLDGLGCVALVQQNYLLAESYFLEAQKVDPEYYHVLGNLALLAEFQGQNDKAESYYQDAIKFDPSNSKVRNNYAGFLAERKGQKTLAKDELMRAQVLENSELITKNLENLQESF